MALLYAEFISATILGKRDAASLAAWHYRATRELNSDQMNELANVLNRNSTRIAPVGLFDDQKDRVAFHATFLSTMGKRHNADISNDDVQSKIGMELELAVRVPNRPGEVANFPLTVIAIAHHRLAR